MAEAPERIVPRGKLGITADADAGQALGEGDAAYVCGAKPHVVTNPLDVPSVGLDVFVPGRPSGFRLERKWGPGLI